MGDGTLFFNFLMAFEFSFAFEKLQQNPVLQMESPPPCFINGGGPGWGQ